MTTSEQIRKQTDEFLAKGGRVEYLPAGPEFIPSNFDQIDALYTCFHVKARSGSDDQ